MVKRFPCEICGSEVLQPAQKEPKILCKACYDDQQDEAYKKDIMKNFDYPEKPVGGLIASWDDSVSYISIKKNRMYFKVPEGVKNRLIQGVLYRIEVKEIK
jgi:hypothetical protein